MAINEKSYIFLDTQHATIMATITFTITLPITLLWQQLHLLFYVLCLFVVILKHSMVPLIHM